MAGPDRNQGIPYRNIFWGNTQKHTPNAYHDRWLLGGFIMGPDDELTIVRHKLDGLASPYQTEATVASQTGLHILIKDDRAVVGLKITDEGGGAGDLIQALDADGTTVRAKLTSGGVWTDFSSRESKEKIKNITDKAITDILENVKVLTYQYIKEPGVLYASPVAEDFYAATKFGDSSSISAKTIGSLALKGVQFLWSKFKKLEALESKMEAAADESERVKQLEERIAKLELRLTDDSTETV